MAPAKTRSRDRSSLPKYRVELPILLDDMDLSVYAFRLYVHLKRVAERSNEGSCWESARTLASACKMSSGQVSKAKDELEQHGLIARHIKMMRGGIGDDITIVDIWPATFARYAPESDHHTITSEPKVITTRSLTESDHHTITSSESDHTVITETIKRSYSDPIDHDQYHIGNQIHGVGVGDRARELETYLSSLPLFPATVAQIVALDLDPPTVIAACERLRADGWGNGAIADQIRKYPPVKGQPYERPIQPQSPPTSTRRSERDPQRHPHNGTGGSDLKDPGWRERLIAKAEAGELP